MKDRILFSRLGGIGDVIHTLPLVKYLRKKYKDASIEYLTSKNIAELLTSACPYIDKLWIFNKKEKKQIANQILEAGRIDYFFNLHTGLSFFIFNFLYIKAKKYFHYKKDKNIHAVVNFAKTYDSSLSAFDLENKTLFVQDGKELLNENDLKEGKYVCFVVGVGKERPHRAWHIENWAKLTEKYLQTEKEFKVVFLGGKDEMRLKGYLPEIENRTVNLIGDLSLQDAAKIIAYSHKVVSCDTGLLHMAAALGTSGIGLYGPTLSNRSGPFAGDFDVIASKDCKCIGNLLEVKRCKVTPKAGGSCMNNLMIEDVLYHISTISNDLLNV